ncbi:23S rRNA (guanine745-N1)-methyltransferase [Alteromonadaceae bacterium 2753L.S.0a.02]|nr:23S rRNA (guanine745-N1)-methyltransferase [Alteromonadaceae bacterium 2753L.S.0a.02]
MWLCPKCHQPLDLSLATPACCEGHCYDRAKQGYLNLLLANKKHSRNPGDNEAMVTARQNFLREEFYAPLVETLEAEIVAATGNVEALRLVDVGCGEGYYLENMLRRLSCSEKSEAFGIDISKAAIRRAAVSAKRKELSNLHYAVANSYEIPLPDNSANVVLNIFAPYSPDDVKRVLKRGATLIRVSPGPRHLFQLKAAIYDSVNLHQPPPPDPGYELVATQQLDFVVALSGRDHIENLLAMTPFNWHGHTEAKEAILENALLDIEASFFIQRLCVSGGPCE